MNQRRILCLGAGRGWHASELKKASQRAQIDFDSAAYESMKSLLVGGRSNLYCECGPLNAYDIILTRTMPAGSFEQVTFRLAMLHEIHDRIGLEVVADGVVRPEQHNCTDSEAGRLGPSVLNPPRSLELAIDKFATLSRVAALGYVVPDTIVVQSRAEALEAFKSLGGDCVVKPIFGGEGRGVMRLREIELAWTVFASLNQVGAVFYIQQFKPPGGVDCRLLVIGDEVIGVRRRNADDFRTNVAGGGVSERFTVSDEQRRMALRICNDLDLTYAAVDMLETDDHAPCVIEVNAIPGWKGAQGVVPFSIAERIVASLVSAAESKLA